MGLNPLAGRPIDRAEISIYLVNLLKLKYFFVKSMFESIRSGNLNRLLNIVEKNRTGLGKSLEKIASGRRLNRAGEDAASLSISTRLRSEIRALTQAVRNVENGTHFIRSAEGGLAAISDLVGRGRELALQAANGTRGSQERQTLQAEFSQIKSEIDRISRSAEFNGQKLLDGSLGAGSATQIDIQAGTGSGPENRINLNLIESTDAQSLGLAGTDISTADGALKTLDALDGAAETVTASRGNMGAAGNRLIVSANGLGTRIENLTQSESKLADTDLAKEISDLRSGLLSFQTSIKTLALDLRQNESATGRLLNFRI